MTDKQIRLTALHVLAEIAPEVRLDRIQPDVSFRDQVEIDSIDFLNFVIALGEQLGVEIPEGDHLRLSTLDGCVEYLRSRQGRGPS